MPRGKVNGLELLQLGLQKMFCATDREKGTCFCAARYHIYFIRLFFFNLKTYQQIWIEFDSRVAWVVLQKCLWFEFIVFQSCKGNRVVNKGDQSRQNKESNLFSKHTDLPCEETGCCRTWNLLSFSPQTINYVNQNFRVL